MENKKVIVMIPMDGNHWDSLDAIWRNYREKGEQVIVIQPPFFRQINEREERLVECEIEGFPEEVEIYSYDAIDLEELHPDIIYINDPGDGYRDGIRVHPFYGAENLKRFTENLVFVPYYYLLEPIRGDLNAMAEMQRDVIVPSAIHADQIIVQSDNIRQVYITLLTALQGIETMTVWENKIKADRDYKLQWLTRGKTQLGNISEECLEFLKKPDGSFKKVILHDVPILSILGNRQKLLRKIEYNLEQFEKLAEEVVYLVKVEPDTEDVIKQLNDALYERIIRIKDKFVASTNAIYDDTYYTSRAMAMCDGYFGESGSIAEILTEVGKPVVIEDLDQDETAEDIYKKLFGEG